MRMVTPSRSRRTWPPKGTAAPRIAVIAAPSSRTFVIVIVVVVLAVAMVAVPSPEVVGGDLVVYGAARPSVCPPIWPGVEVDADLGDAVHVVEDGVPDVLADAVRLVEGQVLVEGDV